MTNVDAIVQTLRSSGVSVEPTDRGTVRLRGPAEQVESATALVQKHKAQILANLLQREVHEFCRTADGSATKTGAATSSVYNQTIIATATDDISIERCGSRKPPEATSIGMRGTMCQVCRRVDRCYDVGGGYLCPVCAEWRVAGCPAFTVLATCDETNEARCGCCLACGGSIELHGKPIPSRWRRVDRLEEVRLVAVRYVVAAAKAIANRAAS